jgi:hypothetical protein
VPEEEEEYEILNTFGLLKMIRCTLLLWEGWIYCYSVWHDNTWLLSVHNWRNACTKTSITYVIQQAALPCTFNALHHATGNSSMPFHNNLRSVEYILSTSRTKKCESSTKAFKPKKKKCLKFQIYDQSCNKFHL